MPPVRIDAPGMIALNAIRSIVEDAGAVSGPTRFAVWNPSISPIAPELTVIWPTLSCDSRPTGHRHNYWHSPFDRVGQRIDRQLGIVARTIHDDSDLAIGHRITRTVPIGCGYSEG